MSSHGEREAVSKSERYRGRLDVPFFSSRSPSFGWHVKTCALGFHQPHWCVLFGGGPKKFLLSTALWCPTRRKKAKAGGGLLWMWICRLQTTCGQGALFTHTHTDGNMVRIRENRRVVPGSVLLWLDPGMNGASNQSLELEAVGVLIAFPFIGHRIPSDLFPPYQSFYLTRYMPAEEECDQSKSQNTAVRPRNLEAFAFAGFVRTDFGRMVLYFESKLQVSLQKGQTGRLQTLFPGMTPWWTAEASW